MNPKELAERIGKKVAERIGCEEMDWDGSFFDEPGRAVIHYTFTASDEIGKRDHVVFVVEKVVDEREMVIRFGEVGADGQNGPVFSAKNEDDAVDYCVRQLREWVFKSDSFLAKKCKPICAMIALKETVCEFEKAKNILEESADGIDTYGENFVQEIDAALMAVGNLKEAITEKIKNNCLQ